MNRVYNTAFCFPPHLHWRVPSWWPSLRRLVLFAFVPPSELWRNFLDQSLAGAQTDPVSPDGNPFHWRSINYNCIIIKHLILEFIDPKCPKICCFHRFQNRYIMFRILYFNKERHWIYISFYFGRIWKVVIKVNLGWHVLLRIGTVLTTEVTEVADKKKKTNQNTMCKSQSKFLHLIELKNCDSDYIKW